jgi:predicted TIM-barrel fold metal-dependent hydrolase
LQSEQAYPFDDVWPYIARLFDAFTVDRVMWGSDYTRLRSADLPRGERPRKRGLSYADSMNFLLRSDRLTFAEKKAVFGGTARRVLRI